MYWSFVTFSVDLVVDELVEFFHVYISGNEYQDPHYSWLLIFCIQGLFNALEVTKFSGIVIAYVVVLLN